jgi:hypothetical protein
MILVPALPIIPLEFLNVPPVPPTIADPELPITDATLSKAVLGIAPTTDPPSTAAPAPPTAAVPGPATTTYDGYWTMLAFVRGNTLMVGLPSPTPSPCRLSDDFTSATCCTDLTASDDPLDRPSLGRPAADAPPLLRTCTAQSLDRDLCAALVLGGTEYEMSVRSGRLSCAEFPDIGASRAPDLSLTPPAG